MQDKLLSLLRCPLSREVLDCTVIARQMRHYSDGSSENEVWTGVLRSPLGFIFPIKDGIPRLLVEAFVDYADFLKPLVPDYDAISKKLYADYPDIIRYARRKNQRTKDSFAFEWSILDYDTDKVWHHNRAEMTRFFFEESAETPESIKGKVVLDAGSGHGILSQCIASESQNTVVGLEMSLAVERAYSENKDARVLFVQGDLMYPPLQFASFDLVHSSGVIHHTHNTELSFSIIHELVKPKGKLCVWLYHPINTFVHKCFTTARPLTCRLPLRVQYGLYFVTLYPWVYLVKKVIKRKPTNRREIMIDLMDGLSPEYRYEHSTREAASWYSKRNYSNVITSTTNWWGFSIVGEKSE